MFKINKERRIADKIRNMLYKRGFKVDIKIAKNTKSVYLKIDNGACATIRISDHKNSTTRSKFNVIKNYEGKRRVYCNGFTRMFYNFHMLGSLIADVEAERSNKILKYGYTKYRAIRDNKDLSEYYIYNKQVA